MKLFTLPPELSKTGQITPYAVSKWRICYSNHAFATVTASLLQRRRFCLFLFLFISAESLKNHSKSQKNHNNRKSNFIGLHMSRSTQ
jgi:hypothetical protein